MAITLAFCIAALIFATIISTILAVMSCSAHRFGFYANWWSFVVLCVACIVFSVLLSGTLLARALRSLPARFCLSPELTQYSLYSGVFIFLSFDFIAFSLLFWGHALQLLIDVVFVALAVIVTGILGAFSLRGHTSAAVMRVAVTWLPPLICLVPVFLWDMPCAIYVLVSGIGMYGWAESQYPSSTLAALAVVIMTPCLLPLLLTYSPAFSFRVPVELQRRRKRGLGALKFSRRNTLAAWLLAAVGAAVIAAAFAVGVPPQFTADAPSRITLIHAVDETANTSQFTFSFVNSASTSPLLDYLADRSISYKKCKVLEGWSLEHDSYCVDGAGPIPVTEPSFNISSRGRTGAYSCFDVEFTPGEGTDSFEIELPWIVLNVTAPSICESRNLSAMCSQKTKPISIHVRRPPTGT
jgi:hypothetical protein